MSHRIGPHDTSPAHVIDVEYFNELMNNVKKMKQGLPTTFPYPLSMLTYYGFHYQRISKCEHSHAAALETLDLFINQLMVGLHEGEPVGRITNDLIFATEKALWDIRNCRTRSVRYRLKSVTT